MLEINLLPVREARRKACLRQYVMQAVLVVIVTVGGMGIFELCQMDISSARQWVHGLDLDGRKAEVAADIVRQVQHRLDFLDNVGVGYLLWY